ncbi:MAG: glycoside hydrolase family 99-like domain-containing protein [Chitinophagales bacterium]
MASKVRIIANYLPQYHPIPENDEWWGKGFTEWTNTAKAKPLFKGHHQPNIPSELGFYDLRLPESRKAQADLAKEHGVEAFCYWHYWMGNGKLLLERPLKEVVESGQPDFPFCIAWANHTWSGIWCGDDDKIICEQKYPGKEDYINQFYYLLKAFKDPRYVRVDGKLLFKVFRIRELPDPAVFSETFRELAHKEGIGGFHLVGVGLDPDKAHEVGFDASSYSYHRMISSAKPKIKSKKLFSLGKKNIKKPEVHQYSEAIKYFLKEGRSIINDYPSIIPNWDSTPRLSERGVVLQGSTPELFRQHVKEAISKIEHKPFENRILFLKSWNEWAEGNYIEPDLRYGRAYLKVLKEEVLF